MSGEKPIYTINDLLKYRKAAYLAARVSGDKNGILEEIGAQKNPLKDYYHSSTWEPLTKYFKPYLPGLTRIVISEIFGEFLKERNRKRSKRRKFAPLGIQGRLLPLGEEAYQNFAKYVWEKRGSPHFKKQLVSGCIWGKPEKIARQDGENGKYEYIAGCQISTNLRSKKFLKLSIAD